MSDPRLYHLVYLATPYTKYPGGIDLAFQHASTLAAKLFMAGVKVYSPISYTHPVAIYGGLDPIDHNIWLPFDETMMGLAEALLVAHMDGWEESFGISEEIKFFKRNGKPIFDLYPETLKMTQRSDC